MCLERCAREMVTHVCTHVHANVHTHACGPHKHQEGHVASAAGQPHPSTATTHIQDLNMHTFLLNGAYHVQILAYGRALHMRDFDQNSASLRGSVPAIRA
jgi:hypothetical protein